MNDFYLLELRIIKSKVKNHHGTCPLKSTVALRYEYIETN